MESLLHYESMRGKVQMIYIDPPYGIKYDSNFQQRVDSTKNDEKDAADDVLTIKAFRDTWALGIHSYLSYLQERLYLCRELLAETRLDLRADQRRECRISFDACWTRCLAPVNFVLTVIFYKTAGKRRGWLGRTSSTTLSGMRRTSDPCKYRQLYMRRPQDDDCRSSIHWVELRDGTVRQTY